MWAAQSFEQQLLVLLTLHGVAAKLRIGALSNDEFSSLLDGPQGVRRTAGNLRKGIMANLDKADLTSFPEAAREGMKVAIDLRNFLAHDYLVTHGSLIGDPQALPTLIAQAGRWYQEIFAAWLSTMDRWIDSLLVGLGIEPDMKAAAKSQINEMRETLRNDLVEKIEAELAASGVDVPSRPPATP